MKIRDLTRRAVSKTVPAWPPGWIAGSYHLRDALPMPDEGVLESVMRLANNALLMLARSGRPFTPSTLGQLVRQGSLADSLASSLPSTDGAQDSGALVDLGDPPPRRSNS